MTNKAGIATRISLADIYVDYDWNARSKSDLVRVIPKDGALGGFDVETESSGMGGDANAEPGLIDLILEQGQLDPCDVRERTAESGPRYELTSGFRRRYAVGAIAERGVKAGNFHPIKADPKWDAREPTLLVVVRTQSDAAARERNLAENTVRNRLSIPDMAFGASDLCRLLKAETGQSPSDADVGRRIGRTPGVVANLRKVMTLPQEVLRHWRVGGTATIAGQHIVSMGPLALDVMVEITDLPTDSERAEAYVARIRGSRDSIGKPRKGSDGGRNVERALKEADKLGFLLAYLAHESINPVAMTEGDWGRVSELLMVGKHEASGDELLTLSERMRVAFSRRRRELGAAEDGVDDSDEEAAERVRQRRDGGR